MSGNGIAARVFTLDSWMEKFGDWFIPITESGCWIWSKSLTKGYGLTFNRGKKAYAHRVSFEVHKGIIGNGLQIDHVCRQPMCVNPDHLRAVTPSQNSQCSNSVSGINHRKTHCSRGHVFDELNTMHRKNPAGRDCRTCHAIRQARRKSASKAGANG